MAKTPSKKSAKSTSSGSTKGRGKGKHTAPHAKQEGYLVLARKYRPQNFEDLIGQDVMVETLRNAFENGRIAQAYILTGVRGVGKTTTARILARALNYLPEVAGKSKPSGEDPGPQIHMSKQGVHCAEIMASSHVDVIEMDAASHTGIDDIREIIEAARYKPMSARYKVYIIDEVHMLSKQAFNGLLKTLEEPPPHVKFIFATTELRKVPVTVLSRCQRFDLKRIDLNLLTDHFLKIAKFENMALEEGGAQLIARAAEGSVRDGLSLLDQAFAHADSQKVSIKDVEEMLALADQAAIYELLEALFSGDGKTALAMMESFYNNGNEPLTIMADLAEAVHVLTRMKVLTQQITQKGSGSSMSAIESGDLAETAREKANELSGKLSLAVLSRAWQMLLKGYDEVAAAPRPLMAAEMVLIRLIHAGDLPSPDQIIRALETHLGSDEESPPGSQSVTGASNRSALHQTDGASLGQIHNQSQKTPTSPGPTASASTAETSALAQLRHLDLEAIQVESDRPTPEIGFQNFEELVAFVGEQRDMRLKLELEEYAEPVKLAPGRVELHLLPGASEGLAGDIGKKLTDWTGIRWIVSLSKERGETTIGEKRRQRERLELEKIKAHPLIEEVLRQFPEADIQSVKSIAKNEISDDKKSDDNI